jgi:hypothetical protein
MQLLSLPELHTSMLLLLQLCIYARLWVEAPGIAQRTQPSAAAVITT